MLVIGSPEVEPAQPRALIGGHFVSALAGFAVLKLAGPQGLAGAVLLTAFAFVWHRWVRRQN